MTDLTTAPADERPITQRDLQDFEERIDSKLDAWWQKIERQLENKASHQEVKDQLRPIQAQQDSMRDTLVQTNQLSAEIKGALEALKSIHGDRVDSANRRIEELNLKLDVYTAASAGLSETVTLVRRDLYGGDGDTKGLQQVITAFGLQMTSIVENQNRVINSALEPLTERLGALETAFAGIEKYVGERKRLEAAAVNAGKRAWSWVTTRSQSTRIGVFIAAGVAAGGWVSGQPVGQIIELIIRRFFNLD